METRRKTIVELLNNNGIYKLQSNKKYYYSITFKNIFVFKLKSIHLFPSKQRGKLIQLQTLKYKLKKWTGIAGIVYFNTNKWDSRIYIIEPGLKGEFSSQPFYHDGVSF
tara:strand:- start:840 stop:1166 length:327 start_codon:yes stop_codon:yes gene_type:complete